MLNVKGSAPVPDKLRSHKLRSRNLRLQFFKREVVMPVNVGENSRYFTTRVQEHLLSDRSSSNFKHLQSSKICRNLCTAAVPPFENRLNKSFILKGDNRLPQQLTFSC